MKISHNTYSHDFERVTIIINNALKIFIDVFKVTEGYKCAAFNNVFHHDDLEGYGFHEDKKESIKIAVKDLKRLMKEVDQDTWFID